jgi:hypothetical protein
MKKNGNCAYKLAENLKNEQPSTNSKAPNGERKIWRSIWNAPVSNKVCVFSWRLAYNDLPTQKINKWRRTLELRSTCSICLVETKDSHHATVQCTKARALRSRMGEFWDLSKDLFTKSGGDWLLILLENT